MKKITALTLVILMLCSIVGVAGYTAGDLAEAVGYAEMTVEVGANVQIKASTGGDYTNGSVSVYRTDAGRDFDFRATLDMSPVNEKINASRPLVSAKVKAKLEELGLTEENELYESTYQEYMAEYDALTITGGFDIVVSYPEGITIPSYENCTLTADEAIYSYNMADMVDDTDARTVTLHVDVADGVTPSLFKEHAVSSMELVCEGVYAKEVGSYTVKGSLTGETIIKEGEEAIAKISCVAVQDDSNPDGDLSATAVIRRNSNSGGSTSRTVTIFFNVGKGVKGTLSSVSGRNSAEVDLDTLDTSKISKEGYALAGWYTDAALTKPVSGKFTTTNSTTLYAKWVEAEKLTLEGKHDAYILGYPDGTVRPNGNLSREEVATIFYRLLTEESREAMKTDENTFIDMEDDRWSNTAVSTMAQGGYIKGYEDNTFKPEQAITRAEFVTIAAKFMDTEIEESDENEFTDTKNHWAEQYINMAVAAQLISGYTDGSFKPDEAITRAEAITILNKLLVRYDDEDSFVDGYTDFDDINEDDWYYYDIIEATNSHTFTRKDGGLTETWEELVESALLSL